MKKLLLIAVFCCCRLFAQEPDHEGSFVKWMTLKEAMDKLETAPKPIILDFYTDWCGWCKTMMKTTYADQGLAQYINNFFYPVKFNAEGKDTVEYLGEKYFPASAQPRTTHPLAAKLLGNKLVYPSTLFLNGYDKEKKEFKVNMIASGYLEVQKIEPILIFILENVGRNASYDDFSVQFQKTFYDSTTTEKQKSITWLQPKGALSNPVQKKKTLVMISTPWCSSCKVMKATSFTDSLFLNYINTKFNLVEFNPETTDTINFKGQNFYNPRSHEMPFHQLAVNFGNNSISFPELIILDENLNVIDMIPSYIPPRLMNDIIHYFGDEINKVKSWEDYMKERKGD